jgi:TPR repeat protein
MSQLLAREATDVHLAGSPVQRLAAGLPWAGSSGCRQLRVRGRPQEQSRLAPCGQPQKKIFQLKVSLLTVNRYILEEAMKAWAAVLVLSILTLGLGSCAKSETREQKFANTRRLAERGNVEAQYNVGLMYEQGYGVSRDLKKAATWFRKAALQGEASAQYRLGSLYYQGQGVPKDLHQAAEWYNRAAEQGCPPAQAALGNMYLVGAGVPKDIAKAAYWHKKSVKLRPRTDFTPK